MALIVQKYGGKSLATTKLIQDVARRIVVKRKEGFDLVVVVSAMGDTTNRLCELAHEISPSPSQRELDMLLSAGERISMSLLSMALNQMGQVSISFTGSQSGIVTDSSHTHAKILEIRADRIRKEVESGKIVIVAGFQGVSLDREVTTLGRGGSDVTAVALAVTLGAERCEFYKDVDGVYTDDPKAKPAAQKMDVCHYDDVLMLVKKGAKVFHEAAILLAQKHSIPLYVSSSFHSEPGTMIKSHD